MAGSDNVVDIIDQRACANLHAHSRSSLPPSLKSAGMSCRVVLLAVALRRSRCFGRRARQRRRRRRDAQTQARPKRALGRRRRLGRRRGQNSVSMRRGAPRGAGAAAGSSRRPVRPKQVVDAHDGARQRLAVERQRRGAAVSSRLVGLSSSPPNFLPQLQPWDRGRSRSKRRPVFTLLLLLLLFASHLICAPFSSSSPPLRSRCHHSTHLTQLDFFILCHRSSARSPLLVFIVDSRQRVQRNAAAHHRYQRRPVPPPSLIRSS